MLYIQWKREEERFLTATPSLHSVYQSSPVAKSSRPHIEMM